MSKIIPYEIPGGTVIKEFKRDPKGKPQPFIKANDWKGDRKKLKERAEKIGADLDKEEKRRNP